MWNIIENRPKSTSLDADSRLLREQREQIELLKIQLQFERQRREVYAERNRRLLGRSRDNRALEEVKTALVSYYNL